MAIQARGNKSNGAKLKTSRIPEIVLKAMSIFLSIYLIITLQLFSKETANLLDNKKKINV